MKASRLLAVLLALAAAAPASAAAQGFEGVIKQQTTAVMPQGVATLAGADANGTDLLKILHAVAPRIDSADPSVLQKQDVTISVKDRKMRMDMGMGGVYTIMDAAAGMTYTVVPAMRQVMTASTAEMAAMGKRMTERMGLGDSAALAVKPTVADLGTRAIRGTQAHGYRVTTSTMATEMWVDPALTAVMSGFQGMQQQMNDMTPQSAWQADMRKRGFPLLSIGLSKAPETLGEGWILVRTDVTSVQKGPVADSLFVPPADFPQRKLMDMMPKQ